MSLTHILSEHPKLCAVVGLAENTLFILGIIEFPQLFFQKYVLIAQAAIVTFTLPVVVYTAVQGFIRFKNRGYKFKK